MSGGHWDYMSTSLEERGRGNGEVWRLLAALERELDWGICGDSCLGCAKVRTGEAIVAFLDSRCEDATRAIALARDRAQNRCLRCGPIR